jgi:hypothetical protein
MGIRHALARALGLAVFGALLIAPSAPAAAAVQTGTIVVTIKTPAGVPGNVRLTSSGRAKLVKKAAAGTSVKVRLKVPVGRWRVSPQQIATSTALYAGSATKSVLAVRAGRTNSVTVTYRKMTSDGTLALTIETPAGVPGTVQLQSGGKTRVATKAPAGTSATVRLPLPAGSWQVVPQEIVDDSALFTGAASRSVLQVPPGGTASATVEYSQAPSVRDLHIVAIEPTRVQLAWTEPLAGASYSVRRAHGTSAPATVSAGTPVDADGATATDTEVSPGETYGYSVFAQAPGSSAWVGPVSTIVTAPPTDVSGETATVVTNPATVMITNPDAVVTSASGGQVTTSVPAGRTPTLGQSWVLPPDTDIPTGYLGKVTAISADGQSVALAPAGLAEAFDYLDVNVPSFESLPVQSLQAGPVSARRAAAAAAGGVISCDSGLAGNLAIDRDLDPYGDLHATLTKTKIFGKNVPVGASFDGEFGVAAKLEANATVEGGASCELDLPKIAIWFMAGPVPMILTAQPNGRVGVSGNATEKVGVTATLGAEFDGYFGLGGDDYINGDLVTSVDPYADVSVAGDLFLNIGADVELGIGSGNPRAGALVGAQATFTALDAHATAVLGQNCLEVSAQRSVSVALEAKAWLGDLEVSRTLDVPNLSGSADWGGSPWTYPNTCAPAEYRVASGTVNVSSNWSGGCSNNGYCNDGDPETTYTEAFSDTSSASLRVADGGGEWVPRFNSDPEALDFLHAPMVFNSWSYDANHTGRWSGYGCSHSWSTETVGPVEFGGSFWQSGVGVAPLADQGLRAEVLDYSYGSGDWEVGVWTDNWGWWSLGAWDTDWANEFPRVPMRDSSSGSAACGYEPWQSDVYYNNLENLGLGNVWWWPEQSRLASSQETATALEGCTPEACRWQVQGTDTYEFKSTVGGDECNCNFNGAGSATVTWSFIVESRTPQPETRLGTG